jgi:2-polyprenyl-6-hydroxyphenyl methylase/3-demethylubiquinone-9 3-methyltransferase
LDDALLLRLGDGYPARLRTNMRANFDRLSDGSAQHVLSAATDLAAVTAWFGQFGPTDLGYLGAHHQRFLKTKNFVDSRPVSRRLRILDVGAHWLHHAFFYANDGHKLFCVDARPTMVDPSVRAVGKAMGARLIICRRLELGDGIAGLPEGSMDLVLFCEIIEHLAFNPIPMWKQIYRVLKPGGAIVITTPNANHWVGLIRNEQRLRDGKGWGVEIESIMKDGTYGHHWKEYTVAELKAYFAYLSADFAISRVALDNLRSSPPRPPGWQPSFSPADEVNFDNIFMEVSLAEKKEGISVAPPWIIEPD